MLKSAKKSVEWARQRIQQVPDLVRSVRQQPDARTRMTPRRGFVLVAVLALLLGGLGAATAAQLLGAGTSTRDAASVQAAAADQQRSAVARGLSTGAPPGR